MESANDTLLYTYNKLPNPVYLPTGDFTGSILHTNNPEDTLWKGTTEIYRSGPFDGTKFSGNPSLPSNSIVNYSSVYNNDELSLTYTMKDKSVISRLVLNQSLCVRQRLTWDKDSQMWRLSSRLPSDLCDNYNICGAFGICDIGEAPVCRCLDGFKPKSLQNWTQMNWYQGCVHDQTWRCREKNMDGFKKFSNVKAPDTKSSWVNASMTLDECRVTCWENCSCKAYANSDIRGEGSGCAIWFHALLDIRLIPNAGQDLGYMAPEYVFDGIFSTKSDVSGFGVLVLEIVSGKKNSRLFHPDNYNNLIGHAWKMWKEGNAAHFIDASLEDSCILHEALRCIHIGMLCVQHHPNDRLNMASVVVLLSNENVLPSPKDPSYLIKDISTEKESSSENFTSISVNDAWRVWNEGNPMNFIDTSLED
ncbi:hypothetical protein Fmac_021278 [Flemingia macrophylla]|uniref:Apple domain-containing protein n=1 Tax=Flemingia macrophylla TaxID=520843 RepID=A0ABD1LWD9_9FABA